jgi:hemerythrin-like domain-containing protein
MKATRQLMDEHEGIKLMLNIIGNICQRLDNKEEIDSKTFDQVIEFLKVFVDKCHHAKEEELLFPALEKAGIAKEGGPIGMMLQEHEEGRNLVKSMVGEIAQNRKDKHPFFELCPLIPPPQFSRAPAIRKEAMVNRPDKIPVLYR